MNSTPLDAARLAFAKDALAVALRHNLLTEDDDRALFAASIECGNLDDAESWGCLVIHDLARRCRSFRPEVLDRLIKAFDAIDAVAP